MNMSESLVVLSMEAGTADQNISDGLVVTARQDSDLDDSGQDYRNSALAVVEVVVLVLILIVAVVGNMFVLIAVWRHSAYRPMSRCYLFMLHLSLADLLVALLNIFPQVGGRLDQISGLQ